MRFDFITSLATTILLCVFAEVAAFGGLVLADAVQSGKPGRAFKQRLAMHPLAPKTIIPFGGFDPILGFHAPAKLKVGNVVTNAHGFIANRPDGASPEGYPGKPGHVFRIVLLGNSTLAGTALRSDATQTIAAHLERRLNAASSDGRTYQVLNFGTGGGYSFSELRLFFAQVIHLEPDAVIALDGWTEAVEAAFATERSGLDHAMINWTLPTYQQYDTFLGFNARRSDPPLVFTYVYLAAEQLGFFPRPRSATRTEQYEKIPWYRDSAQILRQHGGSLEFQFERNVDAIASYCKENGIYYVNYLQPFAAYARARNEEEEAIVAAYHASLVRAGDRYWELTSYRARMMEYYAKYKRIHRTLSNKYQGTAHVRFVDISELFASEPRTVYLDAAHYNETGNRIIADRFAADLASLVAARQDRR